MARPPAALTVAGSDPSGGAGIQADLKTFHQFGVYGTAAVACITVQNTVRVSRVVPLDPDLVREQIVAVIEDIHPAAAKAGALATPEVVLAVAEALRRRDFPLVVDPVMISKHGAPLLSDPACAVLRQHLLPIATLVTPNLAEASLLTGMEIGGVPEMRQAAARIAEMGAEAVLVKGGHLSAAPVDVLYWRGEWEEYAGERIETSNTHGTGCAYSAAITALLARGVQLSEAIRDAKAWLTEAIRSNPGIGHGSGPINHSAPVRIAR